MMTEIFKELQKVTIGSIAQEDIGQLYDAWKKSCSWASQSRKTKQWIEGAILLKYQEQFLAKRLRLNKESGVVHLEDGNIKISCNIPKKVKWDQDELTQIVQRLIDLGVDYSEYIKIAYSVKENNFNSWPKDVQEIFRPARKFGLGSPSLD